MIDLSLFGGKTTSQILNDGYVPNVPIKDPWYGETIINPDTGQIITNTTQQTTPVFHYTTPQAQPATNIDISATLNYINEGLIGLGLGGLTGDYVAPGSNTPPAITSDDMVNNILNDGYDLLERLTNSTFFE